MKSFVHSDLPPSSSASAISPVLFHVFSDYKSVLAAGSAALALHGQVVGHPHENQPPDDTIYVTLHDFELGYSTSAMPNPIVTNVSTSSEIRRYMVNDVDIYGQLRDKIPGGIFELTRG